MDNHKSTNAMPMRFFVKTVQEAQGVVKQIIKTLDLAEHVYPGFFELIINAIEHGNLEIDYATKTQLIDQGLWLNEIEKRLATEPYNKRKVEITVQEDEQFYCFTVKDQGSGFNWLEYTNVIAPQDTQKHGRGILIAQIISFDKIEYQGKGNCVKAFLRKISTK